MKTQFIPAPGRDVDHFGRVPEIKWSGLVFPSGLIRLRRGSKETFGVKHIWHRHQRQVMVGQKPDVSPTEAVAFYVAKLLRPRTPIYCEGGGFDERQPLLAVNSWLGTVVLQCQTPRREAPYYSIVTAFERRTPYGTLLGQILEE